MITHTNNVGSTPAPLGDSLRPRGPRSTAPSGPASGDTLSTENATQLKAALAQTPAVRAEVVERAAPLATDPSYPSGAVIDRIAAMIVRSPDLSNQED
jgi:hypothetical protein